MKLSEAIRLGAMLKPQAFGAGLRLAHDVPIYGDVLSLRHLPVATCAIGAGLEAVGEDATGSLVDRVNQLYAHFPMLTTGVGPCPACAHHHRFLLIGAILHLNDGHHWTRERIADFVEEIERQQEQSCAQHEAQAEPVASEVIA